ncbi:MAG TPA: di-heme oxidoredictase family protein [Verrucomicrobiae bacterium]|nr:di-heme oxidoredictase family protein [Verrucomicrobiae bacterium]
MKCQITVRWSWIALLIFVGVGITHAQPVLDITTGVELSWPTTAEHNYQPQSAANPNGDWTALGAAVPGDGSAQSLFDPVASGARSYQVLEIIPGSAPVSAILENGSFESGEGITASNWSVTQAAGGPVYGVRTNSNPHNGSSHFEVHLASTGAGPVVAFGQTGIPVTGGNTYPFSFYANALAGSAGQNVQWRIQWNSGGDTGFHGFTPGNNTYAFISNSVTAPQSASSATISFYCAGSASPSQSATIQFDDVTFGSSVSDLGVPAQTNILPVATRPVARISWATVSGVQYQPVSTTNLTAGTWSNFAPMILGDGSSKTITVPMTRSGEFIRLQIPAAVILPPANLHTIASGLTNAIGLGWVSSSTTGVTGYRILYGTESGNLTNAIDVGNVTSAIISDLTPGQTYFLAVVTFTADGESDPLDSIISAQTDSGLGIIPLFDENTPLEPATSIETSEALITYVADRVRDRHAREGNFHLYDHYLSWYWEQRVANVEIIDRVAKGGSSITFNYVTHAELNPAEFRTFFRGINTVAEYHNNQIATLVSTNASATPGETDYHYTATINSKAPGNFSLQLGDRVEVEISQFLLAPRHGRANYYGTAMLYIVGQGIVPWGQGNDMGFDGGIVGDVNQSLGSYPLPTNAWLGGKTTLPYQYSNEPEQRFKETAGNIAPTNGLRFMLGRRLHHTDFGDGTHSEPDNPIFSQQIGKLGPKFANRSCVACHVNNGRALPPVIGAPMLQSIVKVGSDANDSPHPILGSVLQSQSISGPAEGSATIASYTIINGQYADGTPYSLRKPNYAFQGVTPTYFSVRLAPQLVGLGLLEAVSESTIMALADPSDANQDGISGRIQTVIDPQTGQQRLGRFNYKAGKARLSHQVAGALNNDMGVTTSVFPVLDGESSSGPIEISDLDLDELTRYIALLGVGARRDLSDTQALRGEQLFASASCVKCHTPTLTTSAYSPMAELRSQTIHPYTDLLLHDLGNGLADNMGEADATGSEWRTPPLWSIGLTAGVSGGEAYLHDGRARSLEEAILWHGGEAESAKESFRTMTASDRAALIKFLKSL